MLGLQRVKEIVEQVADLPEAVLHRQVGALSWLGEQGQFAHRAFLEFIPLPELRLEFPGLPDDETLEEIGRGIVLGLAESVAGAVCRNGRTARRIRFFVDWGAGFAIEGAVSTQLGAALAIFGATAATPAVASFAGTAIGAWLVGRGWELGCRELKAYVEAHPDR